jgi:hypothetical protein
MIRNDDCDWNEARLEQDVVLKTMGGCVQGEDKRQGNLRTNLETEFMNSVRILKSGYRAGSVINISAKQVMGVVRVLSMHQNDVCT